MPSFLDRALIASLLQDESLSFREIARRADCSDWSVRAVARELVGDNRPMKNASAPKNSCNNEPQAKAGWAAIGIFLSVFAGATWLASRAVSSPEQ